MNSTRNSTICFVAIGLEDDEMMKHVRNIHTKQYANNCSVSEPVPVLLLFFFFGTLTHIPLMSKIKIKFNL
jgi:hypothetical protein